MLVLINSYQIKNNYAFEQKFDLKSSTFNDKTALLLMFQE